jgi:hypothetical protein
MLHDVVSNGHIGPNVFKQLFLRDYSLALFKQIDEDFGRSSAARVAPGHSALSRPVRCQSQHHRGDRCGVACHSSGFDSLPEDFSGISGLCQYFDALLWDKGHHGKAKITGDAEVSRNLITTGRAGNSKRVIFDDCHVLVRRLAVGAQALRAELGEVAVGKLRTRKLAGKDAAPQNEINCCNNPSRDLLLSVP